MCVSCPRRKASIITRCAAIAGVTGTITSMVVWLGAALLTACPDQILVSLNTSLQIARRPRPLPADHGRCVSISPLDHKSLPLQHCLSKLSGGVVLLFSVPSPKNYIGWPHGHMSADSSGLSRVDLTRRCPVKLLPPHLPLPTFPLIPHASAPIPRHVFHRLVC